MRLYRLSDEIVSANTQTHERALLSVYWALLGVCRALLSV